MKKLLSELFILVFLGTVIFAETGTVLDDRVRVRSAPSLKYSAVVGVVNKGDKLDIMSDIVQCIIESRISTFHTLAFMLLRVIDGIG